MYQSRRVVFKVNLLFSTLQLTDCTSCVLLTDNYGETSLIKTKKGKMSEMGGGEGGNFFLQKCPNFNLGVCPS